MGEGERQPPWLEGEGFSRSSLLIIQVHIFRRQFGIKTTTATSTAYKQTRRGASMQASKQTNITRQTNLHERVGSYKNHAVRGQ